MKDRLLCNALIVNEGREFLGCIGISDGKITTVIRGNASDEVKSKYREISDLTGKIILPGVIDSHVHFREPGLTHKADIFTESRAGASGGVTSVFEMPNTKPPTVTNKALEEKQSIASRNSAVNYAFYIGGAADNLEELKSCDYKSVPGIKVFLGTSTGNMAVTNQDTLKEIFSLGRLVAVHCEDEETIRANAAEAKAQFPDGVPIEMHALIRNAEACEKSTRAAISLAEECGTRLHICHISTAREVEILRSLPEELRGRVTGEACVNHLWFDDTAYSHKGSRVKWNPAVKSIADRDALRRGVADGVISVVSTDHSPHLLREKEGDALTAASGGPLIEHSLLSMLELAKEGVFPLTTVAQTMAHNQAELFKIKDRGFIREGCFADLVIVDPKKKTIVAAENLKTKCRWSPFEGTEFSHRIDETIVNGESVWKAGKIKDDLKPGRPLEFMV